MTELYPAYLHTVVVPIAKPATAPHMLELATALVDPDEGKVIALTVAEGEGEETSQRVEDLQPILDDFVERGHHIQQVTQISSSVTRGILDGAREHGADALIIGVQQAGRRQVKLGSVVENIISAAPCDVLIYRLSESPTYDRVVVPIDNSASTLAALNIGVLVARKHNLPLSPHYVQRDYTYRADREKQLRQALESLPQELIHKDIIPGRDPARHILNDVDEDDLLVLGFSQKSDLDLQFEHDVSSTLLNRAAGPVLLSSRIFQERDTVWGAMQRRMQRFNPALTQVERNEMVWQARKSAMSSIDYNMLILMSAALASLGLLLNSAAVIIGAMLVAPLMSPLGALATGLATGQVDITRRAATTLLQGVLIALLISVLMGWLLPIETPTTEMLARGNPSLLDAAVALFSGFVAAFALARKEIPAALAGVAIAAALMPPICTIGLALALRELPLAGGSTLLFIANIVFIIVAQNLILLWVGMRPGRRQPQRGVLAWWALILGLLVVVVALLISLGQRASDEARIEQFLQQRLPQTDFVQLETDEGEGAALDVLYTVRSRDPITAQQVAALEAELSAHLERAVNLEFVLLPIVDAPNATEVQVQAALLNVLADVQVIDFTVNTSSQRLHVTAVVRSNQALDAQTVQAAEDALSQELARPVRLTLIVQQAIIAPENTAEATELPEAE